MTALDHANAIALGAAVLLGLSLADASASSSAALPRGRHARIASGSMVADPLLIEFCAPERIAALTPRIRDNPRYAERARALPSLANPSALEQVLSLAPDLLVVSHFANPQVLARLRERGIDVIDLGPMHGMETLPRNILDVAELCGQRERGAALVAQLDASLRALAATVPTAARPRGMYLAVYATKLFGGARRTSYHDVLTAAGIIDVAADRYEGWPELGAEQVLALDPEMFVTKRGMGAVLCSRPGLELSRPCRGGRVVEIEGTLIDDPGLAIVETAKVLRALVHGGHGDQPK